MNLIKFGSVNDGQRIFLGISTSLISMPCSFILSKAEFRKAVQPVYDQYTGDGAGKVSKDLLQQVQNFKA